MSEERNDLRSALMQSISEVEESSPGSTGRLGEIAESHKPEQTNDTSDKQASEDQSRTPPKGADGKFQKAPVQKAGAFQKAGQLPPKQNAEAAGKEPQAKQETKETSGESAKQEPPKPGEAPSNLPPDVRAEWATLTPAMKAFITRRETEHSQSAGKIGRELQQLNNKWTPIEQVIGDRMSAWQVSHGSPAAALKYLVDVSDFAGKDPQGFLAWYVTQPEIAPNINLQQLFGQQAPGQGQGQPKQSDPVVAELQKQLKGLQGQIQQFQGVQQQANTRSVAADFTAFEQEKDAQGNLLHPYFADVRDHQVHGAGKGPLLAEMKLVRADNPNWSTRQVLQEAYDRTVWKLSDVRTKMQTAEQQRATETAEAKKRADAAKLAKKSVAGSPPSASNRMNGSADSRSTLRADIESAWQEANSKGQTRL